jgi:hypothetical protein
MNTKKIFGEMSKLVGIVFLLCAAIIFVMTAADNSAIRWLTFFGVFGLIFLISGLGIVRSIPLTEDEILGRSERVHR